MNSILSRRIWPDAMNRDREPVWDAKNTTRRLGDTTFETCGWCSHRGCGSHRYDCMISGNCELLKTYGNEVFWDTECKIKSLGRDDILDIIKSKKYDIEENRREIERRQEEIIELTKLTKRAKNKPPLPNSRKYNYYNAKDSVWVYHENKWVHGVVVEGYRHHDGCVSYILDDYPESNPGVKGPWGCGTAVPSILKDWEYKYFRNNPDDWATWCKLCDISYNGSKIITSEFIRSLQDGNKNHKRNVKSPKSCKTKTKPIKKPGRKSVNS